MICILFSCSGLNELSFNCGMTFLFDIHNWKRLSDRFDQYTTFHFNFPTTSQDKLLFRKNQIHSWIWNEICHRVSLWNNKTEYQYIHCLLIWFLPTEMQLTSEMWLLKQTLFCYKIYVVHESQIELHYDIYNHSFWIYFNWKLSMFWRIARDEKTCKHFGDKSFESGNIKEWIFVRTLWSFFRFYLCVCVSHCSLPFFPHKRTDECSFDGNL